MPTLLDLLYRRELYRRWCNSCTCAEPHRSGDAPAEELLDLLVSVELDVVRPEEAAETVEEILACVSHLGPETALRQILALRAAVMEMAPEAANLAGFHSFLDLIVAEIARTAITRLRHEATTDPLTRLANRRRLVEDLRREIARAERSGRTLTLVIIDIDHLKATNDVHGHDAGDRRLVDLADRLRLTLRQGDAAYRVGGDEFVLVLPDTKPSASDVDHESLPAVLQRLAEQPEPGFSWGIASFPADGADPDSLLRAADNRLIRLRRAVRGGNVQS